jgi:hypothetical protein
MSYLGSDDFIFYKENGKIISGGYTVNSILLNSGISPMQTNNIGNQTGGKVSSVFENLAVPAGLFYAHPKQFVGEDEIKDLPNGHETLPDDIHDTLFKLVEVDKKRKRITKKARGGSHSNKNTRKNKNE